MNSKSFWPSTKANATDHEIKLPENTIKLSRNVKTFNRGLSKGSRLYKRRL